MRLQPGTWETIERSLDDLIAHTDPKLLSSSFHATLYTAVFNYMSATRLHAEYHVDVPGLAELRLAHLRAANKNLEPAGHIYCTLSNKLKSHFTNILNAASELHTERLLEYYSSRWRNYLVMARMLDHDCAYLTRHWVKLSLAKRPDVYTVEAVRGPFSRLLPLIELTQLATIQWKTILVDGLQDPDKRLTKALLDLVSSHRAGKAVNLDLLKSVFASLATLGRSGEHGEIHTQDVYQEVFENVFVHESTEYYRREAAGLALGGVRGYVSGVGRWLGAEEEFADALPTKESYAKLQTVLRDTLVIGHSQLIEAYMGDSISQTHHGDLKELYSFCLRLGALDHLRETFMRLFSQAALRVLPAEKDGTMTDTQSVLEVKAVYSDIVVENFEKDDVILEALDGYITLKLGYSRDGIPTGT
ncbi:Cullin repeat-like-containing domain protein [Lanmaoa asiatica]|nr:Cullin repeat-like-containing domain protein [Lanmaoa asiatica]